MIISILIPCYNEIKTFELLLEQVLAQTQFEKEIIIIDDFSNDGTKELLGKYEKKVSKIIYNKSNCGKGFSIIQGIAAATGDIILIQDADLEYSPSDYDKLINPIIKNFADVVYGSRFRSGEATRVLYFWHSIGNKLLTMMSNMMTNLNLTDMENCYKVFRTDILKKLDLRENRFGFEPEVTAKISKLDNIRIFEVSTKYFGRTYKEGKKITWKDGFAAIFCIIKYKFFN